MTEAPPPRAELAARVWSDRQAFVAAQDRRRELREALDLGRERAGSASCWSLPAGR